MRVPHRLRKHDTGRLNGTLQHIAQLREPLERTPQRGCVVARHQHRAALLLQLAEQGSPAARGTFLRGDDPALRQHIVEFVGIARLWPGLFAHHAHGLSVQFAQVLRGGGIERVAHTDGPRAAFLERRGIEEGIGLRIDDLVAEGRRLSEVLAHQFQLLVDDPRDHTFQLLDVHRLREAVVDGLLHQGMLRHFALPNDVLQAGELIGEHQRDEVLAGHALDLRRHALVEPATLHGQCARGVPPPARPEHRRIEQGLHQDLAHGVRMEVLPHILHGEAVRAAKGEDDGILGGGGLQFEVEGLAEALAQCQPKGADHAPAEGRVDHQLHAAGFIEETLGDDTFAGGHRTQSDPRSGEVFHGLVRDALAHTDLVHHPGDRSLLPPLVLSKVVRQRPEMIAHFLPQPRNGFAQFLRTAGRFTQPEGQRGWLAFGVDHAHLALAHTEDAPGAVAQLEDVAFHALDREVLVQRTDVDVLRFSDHIVVEEVGDRAAADHRHLACTFPCTQAARDDVAMDVRATLPAPRGEAISEHLDHLVEGFAVERAEGIGAEHDAIELLFVDLVAGHLGDDLLRQDVDRPLGHHDRIELTAAHGIEERDALHQFVARQREQASLRKTTYLVAASSDALEERRDAEGVPDLADEVHVADVDAELERGGGDQRLVPALLQIRLRFEALLA